MDSINERTSKNRRVEKYKKEIETAILNLVLRESEDDEEKQWLIEHCQNEFNKKLIKKMTVLSLHVLDVIGRTELINGTSISNELGIPKGTVSKITYKLVSNGLIKKESLSSNRKEKHYAITPVGKELFCLHQELHKQIDTATAQFFEKYDESELQIVAKFLADTVKTSFIKVNKLPLRT